MSARPDARERYTEEVRKESLSFRGGQAASARSEESHGAAVRVK